MTSNQEPITQAFENPVLLPEEEEKEKEKVGTARSALPEAKAVVELLPESMGLDILRSAKIVPLRVEDGVLIVGAVSLDAYTKAQMLGVAMGLPIDLELHPDKDISDLLHTLYDIRSVATDEAAKNMEGIEDIDDLSREDVLSDSVDVPVIRLVNGLFVDALKQRATDIHVEPYEDEVLIRFRVDGVLQDRLRLPRTHQAPLTSRIKVMAKMDIAEHMAPQDGRIGITLGDRAVDIRVGLVPTQYGERLAMRMLDKGHGLLTLQDLGMEEHERRVMESLIYRPHGMILFTGPTGSGKSTSLYAILQALAKPQVNIITVEDPIEYSLHGVAQIQVNEKAGVTFASALRSILRQDPDIVMIGEMRDFETAHIGVQASLTGHLVLSTLHTNDSIGAVIRLVDMGIEPYLAASCIIGTVAQRLARRLCPHCRRPVNPPAMMARQGVETAYEPVGCPQCNNTGYRGRLGLYEQFVVDEEIQEAVSAGATASKLREIARRRGFKTLWEIGLDAVSGGKTSPDELARVAGEE
ncbi:MAG: Flp pilus assembly complex ATPase component TadA [Synergistaceae bacterium]|jgi:type II secretory ATPase GspE/PulE/Tfp pilus assembly ATPase PilB-like protein|nr:Flp pilus assembly complex ATPase component TadA [Synergistaceae bacterium]